LSARIYMLLDVVENRSSGAIQTLRAEKGVVISDVLEGHPNILILLQAPNRTALATHIVSILDTLDGAIEDVQLLVTPENEPALNLC
jgi:hypothetical protein